MLTYTDKRPEEPGYYWLKQNDSEIICNIFKSPGGKRYLQGNDGPFGGAEYIDVENISGLWAGPICKPNAA